MDGELNLSFAEEKDEIDEMLDDLEGITGSEEDIDGYSKIDVSDNKVFLTVFPPSGGGKLVELDEVMELIRSRNLEGVEVELEAVKKTVYLSSGQQSKIAEYQGPSHEKGVEIEIAKDRMRAYLTVHQDISGEVQADFDDCLKALNEAGVVAGIIEDAIRKILEARDYNKPVAVAEATLPTDGVNAQINFKFDKTKSIDLEEDDKGRVDFRDLDLIENVVMGQVLGFKILPTEGEPGQRVTGEVIPNKRGKDIAMPVGKNVELSEDATTMVASINGHVKWTGTKVMVEEVFETKEVNLSTGNIVFLGSVVVKGDVNDNFTVKATADIHVYGSVGRAILEADGNIIVRKGILGKKDTVGEIEGMVKAGGNVYAQFVENANIEAGGDVEVRDAVLHSTVDAEGKVIVGGAKGLIVGGQVRAAEEVTAKTLGSELGVGTDIAAGVNPKILERLAQLRDGRGETEKKLEAVDLNTKKLLDWKKRMRKLPPDKEEILKKLLLSQKKLIEQLSNSDEEIAALSSQLNLFKEGKVRVTGKAYPGVKIMIRNASLIVADVYQFVVFFNEAGDVRILPYE